MNLDNSLSIQQSFDDYLLQLSASKPEGTVRAYNKSLSLFAEFLEALGIDLSGDNDVLNDSLYIEYLSTVQTKNYSKSSATVYVAGVKNYRNWLIENGYMKISQSQDILFRKLSKETLRKFRTTKKGRQIQARPSSKIIQSSYDHPRKILEDLRNIAVYQLLRNMEILPYEICRLRVKDCDFVNYSIRVQYSDIKIRTFTMNDEIIKAISDYWVARGWRTPDDPVFARHDKGAGSKHCSLTTRSIQNIIRNIGASAGYGKGFTPTALRLNTYLESIDYPIDISRANQFLSANFFKSMSFYDQVDVGIR